MRAFWGLFTAKKFPESTIAGEAKNIIGLPEAMEKAKQVARAIAEKRREGQLRDCKDTGQGLDRR